MKKQTIVQLLFVAVIVLVSCNGKGFKQKKAKDSNGYNYEYVTNDPLNTRIYTLENGLKVYLSVNKDEPRIQGFIGIKAGSSYDPADNTGLAHYLEHLMFKGTSKFGTTNWEKEKPLLDEISLLFEEHKKTSDPKIKEAIYAKIDSVSQVASQYAIASEYDKMSQTIGAKGTNAYTTNERTVYMNDVPSNELERWLMMERERFGELVLRLFHTELETVYEEFNISQDNDSRKEYEAFSRALFPRHPYGQQTTLGKAEHLKNPSMVNIHNYWNTYYVPNNMAICLSGDLDYEKSIQLIDKYFGNLPRKEVPKVSLPVEEPVSEAKTIEVFGPSEEDLMIGWRIGGENTKDKEIATLIGAILSNNQAGLIDLNLKQQQKVLDGGAFTHFYKEYGILGLYGSPREGQSLDEVKALLMAEMEKLKNGEFEDWLIQAVINDMRLSRVKSRESNFRAHEFVVSFANEVPWAEYLAFENKIEKISRDEIIGFAKENFRDNNYILVNKKIGKDENVVKVDKPKITDVEINRTDISDFVKNFEGMIVNRLEPKFVDFVNEISTSELAPGVSLHYIKNSSNELFTLEYIVEMGKNHHKILPVAINFLPFLGTDKYSPAELQKEFYKLGLSMEVFTGDRRSYIKISGLESSVSKAIELLEHAMVHAKPNQEALLDYITGIKKERSNNKLNKNTILWKALYNYGIYGPQNPFTQIPSSEELDQIKPEELTEIIQGLFTYQHRILYYGNTEQEQIKKLLNQHHKISSELKSPPAPEVFEEVKFDKQRVLVVDYDMVQVNYLTVYPDVLFNKELWPYSIMFNEFYSSLVYQDIRESKGLAYSTFAQYTIPQFSNQTHKIQTFVGTQPDKLKIAFDALENIMNNMPDAQIQFDAAKDNILKQMESNRIIKENIFWTYISNLDKGINYDIRKDNYKIIKDMNIEQFRAFFDLHIKNKKSNYLILANKKMLDEKLLKSKGEVQYLSLEEIFNY